MKYSIKEIIYYISHSCPAIIWGKLKHNLVYVHWGRGMNNFGDCLSPDILRYYGKQPVYVSSNKKSDIILAGSILQWTPKDYSGIILGTGGDCCTYNFPKAKVLAVRGNLTLNNFVGIDKNKIILGDSGLLMPLVYPRVNKLKKYRVGIIPHFVDQKNTIFSAFISENCDEDIHVINVFNKPKKVCQEICSCEYILSSSLHGLILSDAYDVPNVRFVIRETMPTDFYDYKFKDYYSSFQSVEHTCIELTPQTSVNEMIEKCQSHYNEVATLIERLDNIMKVTLNSL